jgi:ABC-type phosphate transport system auxiliary subunit
MQFCSVTFVLAEAILRKLRAKVTHDPVACDLGDHTCRSDAQTDAIAIDNCRLRKWKRNDRQTVNQNVLRRLEQRFNRQAHRAVARAQDVNPVDLNRIDDAYSPSDFGIRNQLAIDFFAQFRRELFGIVQATMAKFFGKNRRSGNNRPS